MAIYERMFLLAMVLINLKKQEEGRIRAVAFHFRFPKQLFICHCFSEPQSLVNSSRRAITLA
jgi:hypothetical protein